MNVNKSIAQLHKEIETARREALTHPWANEVRDTVTTGEGGFTNSLSDIVAEKRKLEESGSIGMQTIPPDVKVKVEKIFARFAHQYLILRLYYVGGFTRTEIAKRLEIKRQNVGVSLTKAVKRLKKYLTESEYDSIRWALKDQKPIEPTTPMTDDMRKRIADHKKIKKVPFPVRYGRLVNDEIIWEDGET